MRLTFYCDMKLLATGLTAECLGQSLHSRAVSVWGEQGGRQQVPQPVSMNVVDEASVGDIHPCQHLQEAVVPLLFPLSTARARGSLVRPAPGATRKDGFAAHLVGRQNSSSAWLVLAWLSFSSCSELVLTAP